jgi:CheY-like chemotaxis protein
MQNSKPILLVEDDRVDAMTVKRALSDLKITNPVVEVTNGEEALKYLRNQRNVKPCFILLDLNMPKMNGLEFLKVIKADDTLKSVPVFVLTTSTAEEDTIESLRLGANHYMVKSIDYEEFLETIKTINFLPGVIQVTE